jgi:hypothetical protein
MSNNDDLISYSSNTSPNTVAFTMLCKSQEKEFGIMTPLMTEFLNDVL